MYSYLSHLTLQHYLYKNLSPSEVSTVVNLYNVSPLSSSPPLLLSSLTSQTLHTRTVFHTLYGTGLYSTKACRDGEMDFSTNKTLMLHCHAVMRYMSKYLLVTEEEEE